jgi:hypothetical protein
MDTDMIGRKHHEHGSAPEQFPETKCTAGRSLTEETARGCHRSCEGRGLSEALVEAMDSDITDIHVIIAVCPRPVGMISPHYATDRQTLVVALATIGVAQSAGARAFLKTEGASPGRESDFSRRLRP